jgi:hypothetical protein
MMACATGSKPTKANFKAPVVTLNAVDVAHYWGWWYFSNKVAPTKGTAGNYGAPLDLAFVFDVHNPNNFPVMMDGFRFTVAFEEFDLNTVSSNETQWIPAGKTNQVRVHAMFDGRQSLLSLLVTGGFKLKAKGLSVWDQLEKWWVGAPALTFPIHVKEGSAVFKAGEQVSVVSFGQTYP